LFRRLNPSDQGFLPDRVPGRIAEHEQRCGVEHDYCRPASRPEGAAAGRGGQGPRSSAGSQVGVRARWTAAHDSLAASAQRKGTRMKVFVSWSGDRSKTIANALKHWLPDVFQGIQVWMSDHDIPAGARWSDELGGELETSSFGILCLTPENLESEWVIFEAGALSKAMKESRVIPYLFQLRTSDVRPPLSQFRGVDANEEGTLKLVRSINDALGKPLSDDERTRRAFEHWWPDLRNMLAAIPSTATREIRADRELLEEILEIVRQSGIRDLNNLLGQILLSPNVRRIEVAPKQVAGQVSNRLALRITVAKKLPLAQIPADQVIPSSIFGMPTDVIEAARIE
jgi:hypothetical protein